MKRFAAVYHHEGRAYHCEFEANSFDDAEARLAAAYRENAIEQRIYQPWDAWQALEWTALGAVLGLAIGVVL